MKHFGVYRIAKRIGWLPVIGGFEFVVFKMFQDSRFYSQGAVKLKKLRFEECIEGEIKGSLWEKYTTR